MKVPEVEPSLGGECIAFNTYTAISLIKVLLIVSDIPL